MKNYAILLLLLVLGYGAKAQSLAAGVTKMHGAGCDNQSGKLKAFPYGGTGTYSYLWSTGSSDQIIDSLPAGDYWLIVYSGSDSVVVNYTLLPFGIHDVYFHHVCIGESGSITLSDIEGHSPLHFEWHHDSVLLPVDAASLVDLSAGTYDYVMTDADGCTDSGSVTLIESVQQMNVFLEDSTLCYWDSTLVWYTPGFTVWYLGEEHNTTTDTLLFVNQSFSENIPYVGIDSLGCESEYIWPPPFIYRQGYPYIYPEPTLYLVNDTVSLSSVVYTEPSTCCTYSWVLNGELETAWPHTYLPFAGGGLYEAFSINEYGCYAPCGELFVSLAGMEDAEESTFDVYPNPVVAGGMWQVVTDGAEAVAYELTDAGGKRIAGGKIFPGNPAIPAPAEAGVYFLRSEERSYKLIVTD